jgi:hypothetical protein
MSAVEKMPAERLDLKAAVALAKRYLAEITEEPLTNLKLEEVERARDDGAWRITLGYDVDVSAPAFLRETAGAINAILGANTARAYRVITLDEMTGEFISMKLRTL